MDKPEVRKWLVLVMLEDAGDTTSNGHRFRSHDEICDLIESMEAPRGMKLARYHGYRIDSNGYVTGP